MDQETKTTHFYKDTSYEMAKLHQSLPVSVFHEASDLGDAIFVQLLMERLLMHLMCLFIEYSICILSFSYFMDFTDKKKLIKDQM